MSATTKHPNNHTASLPEREYKKPNIQSNCKYGWVLPDRCRYNRRLGCECGAYPPIPCQATFKEYCQYPKCDCDRPKEGRKE